MTNAIRKNYYGLDIAKFVCALMIISSHFAAEQGHFPRSIDLLFSVYIFAVPFFFTCSAFLFFKKLEDLPDKAAKRSYFIAYEKRIWCMYLAWSVIYWAFRIAGYVKYGTTLDEVLSTVHTSLVLTTYATIWFLPALGVAIAVVYAIREIKPWKLILTGAVLYAVSCLGYSYIEVSQKLPVLNTALGLYGKVFLTTRNGLFNGVPFVIVGYFVAVRPNKMNTLHNVVLAAVFSALTIFEGLICKLYISPTAAGADTVIMLIPAQYFIISFLVRIQLQKREIYIYMRKLSILMFTSQRLFLSAIPGLWAGFMAPFTANTYIGLFMMIALVILFDLLLIKLSSRVKVIRYLM